MTPLVLAERARAMAAENGLECEVLDQDRMRQLGMGSLLGVAQGQRGAAGADRGPLQTRRRAQEQRSSGAGRQGRHLRYRRRFHQARRGHGEDEVRHGRRRGCARARCGPSRI